MDAVPLGRGELVLRDLAPFQLFSLPAIPYRTKREVTS